MSREPHARAAKTLQRTMFVDFDNLGMLPLDMDDELRPRAPPSASSQEDSQEDFEIVAERRDEGAPAAEMRGFAGWGDRGTVARAARRF